MWNFQNDIFKHLSILRKKSPFPSCNVMTLTLGLQPKQRHGKVWAENAAWESHLHSLNVKKCEEMNPHIPKWTPTLGVEVLMESQIFKGQF
jgi:hypothetical protein